MSTDHGGFNDKERSDALAGTDGADRPNKDDSVTTLAEANDITASGHDDEHDVRDSDDENSSPDLSQVSVGSGRGPNDEENQREQAELEALERLSTRTPIHSIFSTRKKRFIIFMTAWGGMFSPMAANIYFAALNPLSESLGVSDSLINLS